MEIHKAPIFLYNNRQKWKFIRHQFSYIVIDVLVGLFWGEVIRLGIC